MEALSRSPLAMALALLLLAALPHASYSLVQQCTESTGVVTFGTGQVSIAGASDGTYRTAPDNSFALTATCTISGDGASTDASRWRAQLIRCGDNPAGCRDPLPTYQAGWPACGGDVNSNCNIAPTGPATFNPNGRPTQYVARFRTTIANASAEGASSTFYYLRCFYVCSSNSSFTQERAGASFALEPPVASFYGLSTATIRSTSMATDGRITVDFTSNVVEVTATCRVQGKYALLSRTNWPGQVLPCRRPSQPAGLYPCTSSAFDRSTPTITPDYVNYNEAQQVYEASYRFTLDPAVINFRMEGLQSGSDLATFRSFTCFYNDGKIPISKRASASVDVYTRIPETINKTASGFGDPKITDFMGRSFFYNGTHGDWSDLLTNTADTAETDPFVLRMLVRYVRKPGVKASYIRAFMFNKNNNPQAGVYVTLEQNLTTKAWGIMVRLDGKNVGAGQYNLAGGAVRVLFTPGADGINGLVRISTDYMVFAAVQPWWGQRFTHTDFLNFNLSFTRRPVPSAIGGLLGPSLRQALRAASESRKKGAAGPIVLSANGSGDK